MHTLILSLLFSLTLFMSSLPPAFAQGEGLGCGEGFGIIADVLCNQDPEGQQAGLVLNKVISNIIGFLTIIAALWFLFQIIFAGYNWISANGDKTRVEAAWKKITNSVLGLVIVVGAWVIVGLVGQMLGLNILDPGGIIQTLKLQ